MRCKDVAFWELLGPVYWLKSGYLSLPLQFFWKPHTHFLPLIRLISSAEVLSCLYLGLTLQRYSFSTCPHRHSLHVLLCINYLRETSASAQLRVFIQAESKPHHVGCSLQSPANWILQLQTCLFISSLWELIYLLTQHVSPLLCCRDGRSCGQGTGALWWTVTKCWHNSLLRWHICLLSHETQRNFNNLVSVQSPFTNSSQKQPKPIPTVFHLTLEYKQSLHHFLLFSPIQPENTAQHICSLRNKRVIDGAREGVTIHRVSVWFSSSLSTWVPVNPPLIPLPPSWIQRLLPNGRLH